jgi:hypothetical protein
MVCAGKLAASVGKEKFPQAALDAFIVFAKSCLKQNDNKYELRETAMTFFYELTDLLEEDIAPHFTEVITEVLKTCNKEDDFEDKKEKPTTGNGPDPAKGFSLDSDSENMEDMLGLGVDVSCLDEKAAAVNSLGYMFYSAPVTAKAVF